MELVEQAHMGDLDELKRLIHQGVDVNTKNNCNQTALYCACEDGNTEVAQYLLGNGASVNLGANPLIAAVRNDRYACVKLLLQYNADVNCTNTERESPMSVALQKQHYTIILLLLQYGATPPASLSDIAVQLLEHATVEHAKATQKPVSYTHLTLPTKRIV